MGRGFTLYRDLADRRMLALFLCLDAFAIGLHAALIWAHNQDLLPYPNSLLRVTADHSLGEFITYAKWILIVLAFSAVYRATGVRLYQAFAWVFLLIGLDDFLRLHEQIGDVFADAFYTDRKGLRDDDQGELTTWALMGLFVLFVLWRGFRSAPIRDWRIGQLILALMAVLVVFAVGLDIGQYWTSRWIGSYDLTGIVEDGGEMITASLIAGLAVGLRQRFAPKRLT